MFDSLVIARYFLSLQKIKYARLQCLCYLAHAYYLAKYHQPLINDKLEAQALHPSFCKVEEIYECNRQYPITLEVDFNTNQFNNNVLNSLKYIWNTFFKMEDKELREYVRNGNPFKVARVGLEKFQESHNIIKNTDIEHYYIKVFK